MLMWWYPGELFFLDGGWQGLKIVALIDLILGPLLTLVLYKPGKKSLVFDMACVAVFQIAALGYGFYVTHQQRTVAIVFADRQFTTLSADAAKLASAELIELDKTPKKVKDLDPSYPAMLLTPEHEPGKFGDYVAGLLNGYPESQERLDLVVKREKEHATVLSQFAETDEFIEESGTKPMVDKAIADGNFDASDIQIFHFKARYAKGLVLFSKSEQEILDYVPIDWAEIDRLAAEEQFAESAEQ